jgi:2-oxoglutarate ferredoxin oxidoreductase subunit alpha
MSILTEQDTVTVRFAGDSGDGMQLAGGQLTNTSAMIGNDVHTFPDFPAEIRAPAGTLPGVSGFQICFSSKEIYTAGDALQALVAMNPAALKMNLSDLEKNGLIILNQDSFTEKEFKKAHYQSDPISSGELKNYRVFALPINELTLNAVKTLGLTHSQAMKCKNMFALGIIYWLYSRPIEITLTWLEKKFSTKKNILAANQAALKAGYNYALTVGLFSERYIIKKAVLSQGTYQQVTGNEAFAKACAVIAIKSECPFLLSGYPITPASAVLQYVAKYAQMVPTMQVFQAEDEIAAMSAVVGAAFGGSIAVTVTSGPGFDLKSEALGLAVMTELPCIVIDVQRSGPSTGMPTKTEQSDLLMALYGRHGESPIPVLSPQSPGDCFQILIEAIQIAMKYMTPIIILSDGYLATSAEPWKIPESENIPNLKPFFSEDAHPYQRNPDTLARTWVKPGTKNLEYRLGGLEKDLTTGNISYDPMNHHKMIELRAKKIANIEVPDVKIWGNSTGKLLVISWGSTYGAVLTAVENLKSEGVNDIGFIHLRNLNPLPNNLETVIKSFKKVLIPELNLGQLSQILRAKFLVDVQSLSKVTGRPFLIQEIQNKILECLEP